MGQARAKLQLYVNDVTVHNTDSLLFFICMHLEENGFSLSGINDENFLQLTVL